MVMTQTGSLLSRTIKLYTKEPYNHVSIGFDKNLDKIYSFGRKNPRNPLFAGFVEEDINDGVYKIFKDTTCRIYKMEISDREYIRLKRKIDLFDRRKDKYKYNLLGLVTLMFGIPLQRKNHYFCSQFVARVLYSSKIVDFEKDFSLVKPNDFDSIENTVLVYEGKLSEYDPQCFSTTQLCTI